MKKNPDLLKVKKSKFTVEQSKETFEDTLVKDT